MRFAILTTLLMALATFKSSVQDCAVIEGNGTCCATNSGGHADMATDKWLININNVQQQAVQVLIGK